MPIATDAYRATRLDAADLAPGERRARAFDWAGFDLHVITSVDDPQFDASFAVLWAEFGEKNEMEPRDVLARRFAWRPQSPTASGYAMRYEMIAVCRGDALAAVRDHTAIVDVRRPQRPVVTHLSHLIIAPPWRGSGLAGWMRALPLHTARTCLRDAGLESRPITLAAEMEPVDAADPKTLVRLIAYEKAGFRTADPRQVRYAQPDFGHAADAAATGAAHALPFSLVLRRVGREAETSVTADEIRATVEALYAMYGESFESSEIQPSDARLAGRAAEDLIELLKPSSVGAD